MSKTSKAILFVTIFMILFTNLPHIGLILFGLLFLIIYMDENDDTEEEEAQESVTPQAAVASQFQGYQQYNFPQRPTYNQLPFQLPLAQLQPLIATQGPVGDTGPAAVAVIGAGAAAGFSWIRRKRK